MAARRIRGSGGRHGPGWHPYTPRPPRRRSERRASSWWHSRSRRRCRHRRRQRRDEQRQGHCFRGPGTRCHGELVVARSSGGVRQRHSAPAAQPPAPPLTPPPSPSRFPSRRRRRVRRRDHRDRELTARGVHHRTLTSWRGPLVPVPRGGYAPSSRRQRKDDEQRQGHSFGGPIRDATANWSQPGARAACASVAAHRRHNLSRRRLRRRLRRRASHPGVGEESADEIAATGS